MREKLQNLAVITAVLVAVTRTAMTVRREISPPGRAADAVSDYRREPDWLSYTTAGRVIGAADAAVTIVVFAEFQCPFCRAFKGNVDELRKRYPNDVRLIYRHYPLWNHPFAADAAKASECAAGQGRFEGMLDALYEDQNSIGIVPWSSFAKSARVPDLRQFDACMRGVEAVPQVEQDIAAAKRLGVRSTPTLLVDGLRIDGNPTLDWLVAHVERRRREVIARRR